MAQRIRVILTDDIDGSDAAETVRFGLDGTQYEIDLSSEHARELRELAGQYIEKARRATGSGRRAPRARNAAGNSTDPGKIRDWAREEGIKVNDRGRVPADIVAQYEKAKG